MDLNQVSNPTIIEACADPTLLNVSLSPAQSALLKAVYALPMDADEVALFTEATGRTEAPVAPFKSISTLAGRRSGKSSRGAAPLAVYESCIAQHEIPETERGVVLVLGPTEKQARTTFRVIQKMIERSPKLRGLIESVRAGGDNEIQLSNGIDIRVSAANQRTVRGDLVVAAILEESCFFKDSDSGQYNLDEILAAIRPALLTLPDSKLICVSSPWLPVGPMYDDWQKRAERPDTLVWKLPSWRMNPTINSLLLWAEKKRDPERFEREYGCEFLAAASALLPVENVDASVLRGRLELPPDANSRQSCVAALDPSSKGNDAFAFALAHKTKDGKVVVDLARQWKAPGGGKYIDYGDVIPSVIDTMLNFHCTKVFSDQICAAALSAMFEKKGIRFEQCSTFGTRAQELYRIVRQQFISGNVQLPDNPELISQLKKLEEQLAEGGKTVVQASSGHDDLAVAACLAIYQAVLLPSGCAPTVTAIFVDGPYSRRDEDRGWMPLAPDGSIADPRIRVPSFGRPR